MKKIVALTLVAVLCFTTVFAQTFTDISGHWAEEEILIAHQNKIVNGDPDGSFRPDDKVSRAEFLKMLVTDICNRAGVEISTEYDTGEHWASKYYNFATDSIYAPLTEKEAVGEIVPGAMNAYNFDLPIARWEMAYILSESLYNIFGIKGAQTVESADFDEIKEAYNEKIVSSVSNVLAISLFKGDENGKFNHAASGTRAETAALINRAGKLMQPVIDEYNTYMTAMMEQNKKYEEALFTYESVPKGHPKVTILMSNNKKFDIELYPEYAPQTVANFLALAKKGFYDGLTFHRVVEGFVAQGGDPAGDGSGGSENYIVGEFLANGFDKNTLSHTRGVVSMARSSHPNSASSQFFICYDNASFLDGQYAAFGKVITGMDVVDGFLDGEFLVNEMGELSIPKEPIVIKRVIVR